METITKRIRLHRTQQAFRRSKALYRGFVGGRGAGKSWVGAYDLIRRARRGRTYLVGSPTGVLLADTTFPTFKSIAKDLGVWGGVKLTPYPTVTLTTGASVRFRTAEDPDKMRGPNLSGVWLDEASLMDFEAYTVSIASLREAGEQGWLSSTFTPKGRTHWTYRLFGQHVANTEIYHARTRDNPFNPPGFHDTLAGQYGGLLAEQELEGKFLNVEGAEWPDAYFPDSMWFDDWPGDIDLKTMALDPSKGKDAKSGDYSAIIELGRDREGMLWCEADLARRHTPLIVAACLERGRRFRPDAFGVETNQFQELLADDIAAQSAETGMMLPIVPIDNRVNKEVRIRRLGPLLARHRIRFRKTPGTELLVNQLREFPEGKHDDGPDGLEMAVRLMGDWLAAEGQEETVLQGVI